MTEYTQILDLDHVYILVTKDAPEARHIEASGLYLLDDIMEHSGQGTASRFFMFRNVYLELVWVNDMQEMIQQSERVGLDVVAPEDWRETGASPFGVGLHYKDGKERALPVPTKKYWAEWMPPSAWLEMIPKASIYEPEYFILSEELAFIEPKDSEMAHPLGLQYLTHLSITVTRRDTLGPMTQLLEENQVFQIREGEAPLMELTFDGGIREKSLDYRPVLPLIVHY
jgi:hypothetical protein